MLDDARNRVCVEGMHTLPFGIIAKSEVSAEPVNMKI